MISPQEIFEICKYVFDTVNHHVLLYQLNKYELKVLCIVLFSGSKVTSTK